MLSRVANSIFWMCRYIERAENIARFINVNWRLMLDSQGNNQQPQWEPLVHVTGDYEQFIEKYEVANRENVIRFLCFDSEYPNSILSCLSAARENARSVREIIPAEMWEHVNTFYHFMREASHQTNLMTFPHDFFNHIVKESYTFVGMSIAIMTHDEGWHFCRAGRMLERADKTSRILDVKYFYLLPSVNEVGSVVDNVQWSALLQSASGLQGYRQKHGPIHLANVVEYLLLDREFPRSVRYCVERVFDSLHCISGTPLGSYANEAERRCGRLHSELVYTQVSDIVKMGIHEFADGVQVNLNGIGEGIFETFFTMKVIPEPKMKQSMVAWED